jgi:hypothetical protein
MYYSIVSFEMQSKKENKWYFFHSNIDPGIVSLRIYFCVLNDFHHGLAYKGTPLNIYTK